MKLPQRFLIIDDDPTNNLLCKIGIQRVIPAADIVSFTIPEKGIAYIKDEYTANPVPTALFLDINMPSLTGWEVLAEFEKMKDLIKDNFTIHILSSSVDPADKERAANNHFVMGYLEKPLNKQSLKVLYPELA